MNRLAIKDFEQFNQEVIGPERIHEFSTRSGLPPCQLVVELVRDHVRNSIHNDDRKFIFWIGEGCWPTPFAFFSDELGVKDPIGKALLKRSRFIRTCSSKLSYWCLETTLRSPATDIAVANTTKLSFTAKRRLSLATKRNNSLCLLIYPDE